ncbi:MAG: sigma-70 family RNA polymerase sigma factor [Paludibacter sp.]|nr:sigma-70 family RNA polymerase sigma factor [Paludibacter sp.]
MQKSKESQELTQQEFTQTEIWNQFIEDGNENSLSQIYLKNYDLLYDYGMRYTSDVEIVEDSIQEVFVSILKYRKKIRLVRNLQGYLITSFRRQLFLKLNEKKRTISMDQLPEGSFDYFKSPDADTSEKEEKEFLHATINECVGNLTNKQKEILYLRFEQDIPYDEIASILNISVDSCYKSIYRTIKSIRIAVEKRIVNSGRFFMSFITDEDAKMKSKGN